MIVIFGGTTEGRMAASILDYLKEEYIYCTKGTVSQKINGKMLTGALDADGIAELCTKEKASFIIDAAHPFATILHHNIHSAATRLEIPVIRVERKYSITSGNHLIRTFASFEEMDRELAGQPEKLNILALTGVQTIGKFPLSRDKHQIYFRILDTELSMQKAVESGIDMKYVMPAPAHITLDNLKEMSRLTTPDIILTKESGESGYFDEKAELAQITGKPLWVVKRPEIYPTPYHPSDSKELMQCILRLRKELMKDIHNLRSGYTTGSCVTAAAAASFSALMNGYFETEQTITMPDGSNLTLLIFDGKLNGSEASCIVIKDSGDDPDVTHSAEIGCTIRLIKDKDIKVLRGKGIGMVTLPGLKVAPGNPAINPGPMSMILNTLNNHFSQYGYEYGVEVIPFIPEGEELAERTFNPRIGVVGGLSVLGTSGYLRPYSSEAFMNAIVQQINVAYRQNSNTIVLTAGKRSEMILAPLHPELNPLSFVHYGNSIGESAALCSEKGFKTIIIGIMLGKAMKLSEGHLDTHSKLNTFSSTYAAELARSCGYNDETVAQIEKMTLANAITDLIPFDINEPIYAEIIKRCHANLIDTLKKGTDLYLHLINPADNRFVTFYKRVEN